MPPRILVTNDDGFRAPGIRALAAALDELGDVIVVAPDRERSAVGHAITMVDPLRVWREKWRDGRDVVVVDGTPADCVKIGVRALVEGPPDLVVSGINQGGHAGTHVIYSGTVSAATEAGILGIKAAAISLDSFTASDFGPAAAFAATLARRMLAADWPNGVLLNVNVPGTPAAEIRGVRITRQSSAVLDDRYEERVDPRGRSYFWLAAERMNVPRRRPDDDITALAEGYISITPIRYDLTDEGSLAAFAPWADELAAPGARAQEDP
jgi:5'-nucleotidase